MPYYCTVPRCTSMAGKAKNVSFHQFPRDEELAKLWNNILKRGKPYTKYSKVCSLHFTPQDYTITSVGKNKGQWRTLRKDAIPSQNLPSESPTPYQMKQWSAWTQPNTVMDPGIQQQMAQAIYMQTMLAMQNASQEDTNGASSENLQFPQSSNDSDIRHKETSPEKTYKCKDCSKCFKDPDVFLLHKRTHIKNEKENFNLNLTLQANPILANLLNTNNENTIFDNNTVTVENLIMTALAAIKEGYMRNLTSFINKNELGHDGNELCHDINELSRRNDLCHERNVLGHERNDLGHGTNDLDDENELGHGRNELGHGRNELGHNDFNQNNEVLNLVSNDINRKEKNGHNKNGFYKGNSCSGLKQNNDLGHINELGHVRNEQNHDRNDLGHDRNQLGHDRNDLGHDRNELGLNGIKKIKLGQINGFISSDNINAQKYHKNRDEVNRDELHSDINRGNSDSLSDSKLYKNDINNDSFNIANDTHAVCDSEMNESIDSDNLVIDETV